MRPWSFRVLVVASLVVWVQQCRRTQDAPSVGVRPRVVSLLPNVTEILFAMGAGEHVVGVTRYCEWPEAACARLPKVGGILDVSVEAVLALRPDIVFGSSRILRGPMARLLSQAGAEVVGLDFESLEDLYEGMALVGKALHMERQSQTLTRHIQREISRLEGALAREPPLRVLLVVGDNPLVVAGPSSYLGRLLALLGAWNVVRAKSVAYPTWSTEQVLAAGPDLIVDVTEGPGHLKARFATANSRRTCVVKLGDSAILKPGPRLPEGLHFLVRTLSTAPCAQASPGLKASSSGSP